MNFLFVINDEIYVKVALCVQKCACLDAYTHQCTFMPGDYTQHIHIYTQIHMHMYMHRCAKICRHIIAKEILTPDMVSQAGLNRL